MIVIHRLKSMRKYHNNMSNNSIKLFDYSISNPPYQASNHSEYNNNANNIFHYFYDNSIRFSTIVTMIFPGGRWLQRSSKATIAAQFIYRTVNTIYWYPHDKQENWQITNIFPTVTITDGITIVQGSETQINDTLLHNDTTFQRPLNNEILPLTKQGSLIIKKISVNNNYESITHRKNTRNFFNIRSYFAERNPGKVVPYGEDYSVLQNPIEGMIADDNPGVKKRVKHYWIESDSIEWDENKRKIFNSFKVCGNSADLSKRAHEVKYRIVSPGMIVGESWTVIGSFDTYESADNYVKYLNTDIVKLLLRESSGGKSKTWGYFVPDLEDYSNDNPYIDFNKNIEDQLYSLFTSRHHG